jgi:hypothetical protein
VPTPASSAREEEAATSSASQLASPDLIGPISTPATVYTAITSHQGDLMSPLFGGVMLPTPATALTAPTPARELFHSTPAEEEEGIQLEVPKLKKKKTIYPAY